jgi:hypothetical protein
MTFWCESRSGSGSADPCLSLIDPDPDSVPDPDIFFIDLQDTNKKLFFSKCFCLLRFEGTFTSFFKDKKVKKTSQNSRNQGFS